MALSAIASLHAQELIAVMDLKSDGSVAQKMIQSICNRISAEVALDTQYTVFDRAYLPLLLEQTNLKQSVPCLDVPCLSDIGTAIGASQVIGGSIELKEGVVYLKLRRVNASMRRTIRTISRSMTVTRADVFLEQLPPIVQDLMASPQQQAAAGAGSRNMPLKGSVRRSVADQAPDRSEKGSLGKKVGWISASVAIVVAGTGATVYFLGRKSSEQKVDEVPLDNVPAHLRQ